MVAIAAAARTVATISVAADLVVVVVVSDIRIAGASVEARGLPGAAVALELVVAVSVTAIAGTAVVVNIGVTGEVITVIE